MSYLNDGEDSYNGQLLKDIKEVSKALYLNEPLLSSSLVRSKSVARTSSVDEGTTEISLLQNKKKKSLVGWDWKKPLKAIAHLGQRRFDVCFLLHVHSIEGLPSNLDGTKLVVLWKRKDEVMVTQPCKVSRGSAEFEETLMHKCSVYGSKHGVHRSAKYEVKLFLVYVSPVDTPWVVLGKHWIDLTRILPLSLEELEGRRSTRKWSTSFKLSGLADSAVLNLSFDYSVVTNSVCDSSSGNVRLKRAGSVPSMVRRSSPHDDGKIILPNPSVDLSQSIDCLYEKLGEKNAQTSTETDVHDEHLENTKVGLDLETDKQADDADETGFSFTGNEVEMIQEESNDINTDSLEIEIIDICEILKDEDAAFLEEANFIEQLSVAELKCGASNFLPKEYVSGGHISASSSQMISESSEMKSSLTMDESIEKEKYLEVTSRYKAAKISTKSQSLDDVTESVANDFLNMLELEQCSYVYTSDSEPTSPREYLLQEFEKEALASGNFLLDFDGEAEYVPDIGQESNDFTFSSTSLSVREYKLEGKSQLLINRRQAKVLEDLETDVLVQEWDLEDNGFNDSLCCSDGFGSPIELPGDKGSDHIGPFAWKKGGGCIRSMNPLLFRRCKDASHLIMQVSNPVVLVSELGSDILDILQSLAASGFEGLCSEVNALMPLEDIMGKSIDEAVEDERTVHDCPEKSEGDVVQEPSEQLDSFPSEEEFRGFGSTMSSGDVPLEALASLAIDGIELLSVEGLKIQCSMSDQDPPSVIAPKTVDQSKALELISFSLTLDEWLRLDHGMSDNIDHSFSEKSHTFGNKLTLAFRVLLRDPFRNNEPVGASMLALIQVDKSCDSSNPSECDTNLWRITDICLAGLKTEPGVDYPWGTTLQQQSGSRWLLANGTGETAKCQASRSKEIIASNPQATRKSLDILWSITTNKNNQEGDLSSSAASVPFTRNPDVIFSNEIAKRL